MICLSGFFDIHLRFHLHFASLKYYLEAILEYQLSFLTTNPTGHFVKHIHEDASCSQPYNVECEEKNQAGR